MNPIVQFNEADKFEIWSKKDAEFGNFWLNRKAQRMTPLNRVSIRRMMFYIEKKSRELFREKLYGNQSAYWLHQKISEMLHEVRCRDGIHEYNLVADDKMAYIGVQFLDTSEWVYIELELK